MGVPRLFPWLVKNFRDAVSHFQQGEKSFNVDHLYLDANGILHRFTQFVYHYGDGKGKIDRFRDLDDDSKRKKVYSLFFQAIVELCSIVTPQRSLYIALDGPAPRAKQNQQRERRFVSARNRLSGTSSSHSTFDIATLSPGTMFMHQLTRYMNYRIRQYMNSGGWKHLRVIFSPTSVPGEGEHKLMNHIRTLSESEKNIDSHCLFGPDGDLIMLCLATHLPKVYLFREDQYNFGYYDYIDMGSVRKELSRVLSQTSGVNARTRNLNDVSNDFIVEGFLVGNDFLPKIQMFHLLEEGLDMMSEIYGQISSGGTKNFLTIDGRIDLIGFREFVREVSHSEEEFLVDQITTRNPKKTAPEARFRNETLKRCVHSLPGDSGPIRHRIDMECYRRGYYAKEFEWDSSIDIYSPEATAQIYQMCSDYLRSFVWVCEYYIHGLPDWGWAYEYHYAPLMHDFSVYVNTISGEEFDRISHFEIHQPSRAFEQLLSILPPTSSALLPKIYRKLMLHPESPLVQAGYYTTDFKIDYEGKLKEFQGVAHLPFVDYAVVHSAYSKMNQCCVSDPEKFRRNRRGKVYYFSFDPEYHAQYSSGYGKIDDLQVRRREL